MSTAGGKGGGDDALLGAGGFVARRPRPDDDIEAEVRE
jgi:hypothetical protein